MRTSGLNTKVSGPITRSSGENTSTTSTQMSSGGAEGRKASGRTIRRRRKSGNPPARSIRAVDRRAAVPESSYADDVDGYASAEKRRHVAHRRSIRQAGLRRANLGLRRTTRERKHRKRRLRHFRQAAAATGVENTAAVSTPVRTPANVEVRKS